MKRKGGLSLFITSCIPGCGQMYQGYMKRGLSLMVVCCCFMLFPMLRIDALAIFLVPAWLYAFFDSYNLRALIDRETPAEDDWLFGLSDLDAQKISTLRRGRHSIVGWGLVILGIYALFNTVVGRLLSSLCEHWNDWRLYGLVMQDLPRVIVTLGIIALGIWFIRGPKQTKEEDIPAFTPPAPEEEPHGTEE